MNQPPNSSIRKSTKPEPKYIFYTALFFGSVTDFNLGFTPADDPESVVVDMKESRVWDHLLEAIHKLGARYQALGKTIKLQHISPNCRNLLKKAGSMVDIVVLPDDPTYHVDNLNKSEVESNGEGQGGFAYPFLFWGGGFFPLFQRIWVPDLPGTMISFHPSLSKSAVTIYIQARTRLPAMDDLFSKGYLVVVIPNLGR